MSWIKNIILSTAITVGAFFPAIAETKTDATIYLKREHGGHGSGVLIAPDTVLTTSHVLTAGKSENEFTVYSYKGEARKVIKWDITGNDVAVLTLEKPLSNPVAEINCKPLSLGTWLYGVGSPYGMMFVTVPIYVSALIENIPQSDSLGAGEDVIVMIKEAVLVTGPLLLGMSGGPVYNQDNKLVGLMSMQFLGDNQEPTGIGAIVPSTVFPQCRK